MSRVYSATPDTTKGERFPFGRVYTHTGKEIPSLLRVEFDRDTDRGLATVTIVIRLADGSMILDPEKNTSATATFRAWVQMVKKGEVVTACEESDLIQNPLYRGDSDQERFVLWPEIQAAMAEQKRIAQHMTGSK